MYIDKLDDIVHKYINKYHRIIKMNPVDVKSTTYIDFDKEKNKEDPKFKVGDHVRISKYKNIKKVEDALPWTYVISDINGEEIVGTFYKNNCKKQIEKSLELKK